MSLVLWSGGIDSTFVLIELLEAEQKKAEQDREPIRTLAINHPQVAAKAENRNARNKIKKALERKKYKFQHLEHTITTEGNYDCEPPGEEGGIMQPVLWIPTAISYLHKNENLYVGYVSTDDAWHYKAWIEHTFMNICGIINRKGKLIFPIEYMKKAQIIWELKQRKLYNHTWYCEEPTYKTGKEELGTKCGKCTPCLTHQTALWQLNNNKTPGFKTPGHDNKYKTLITPTTKPK